MVALDAGRSTSAPRPPRLRVAQALFLLAALLAALRPALPEGLVRPPEWALLPWDVWLQAAFDFVREDLGLVHLTRALAAALGAVLDAAANLLHGQYRWPWLGPIPWTAITAAVATLGYWLGGWRLAALAGGAFVWTALVGQWELAMETMAVIVVAAPTAFAIGLAVGVLAWRRPRVDRALRPVLAVMQTLPFFTYLLPAVIFFKVGPTAAAVATIAFSVPPMILMTTLGLKKVPPEVVEAGQMAGATRWQMLWNVCLPTARSDILIGVNQVIMLSLAMVVLTSFIGMPGLGAKLLSLMGSFRLGRSLEIGVTIVLIAITLDRMSKAWVVKQPTHHEKDARWWSRHREALTVLGAFAAFLVAAQFVQVLDHIGRRQDLSMGRELDQIVKAALDNDRVEAVTEGLRAFFVIHVLIPLRDALLWLPSASVILAVGALGWLVGGARSAATAGGFFLIVALTGWWDRSMITLYTVLSAVALAALFGVPIAVLASRSERWSRRILLVCDSAQTFPSFVYLIPAVMLFGVNDVAVVFSILIFAMVPLTRYTIEGLRGVPPEIIEAVDMAGATRAQKLWSAQLPIALPTMAVGFNQAIMFSFFMVIIAAFIGTQDLGQELQRTMAGGELGKNFVLGLCVSLMALSFDHIISRWVVARKAALGF